MSTGDMFLRPEVAEAIRLADESHAKGGGHFTVWINYHTHQTVTLKQGEMPSMVDMLPLYDTEEGKYE